MKKTGYAAIVVLLAVFVYWYFFTDMGSLPEGKLMATSMSPGGEYTVNLYLCGGNATTAYSVRGEAVSSKGIRNIYWQYEKDQCNIQWESDNIVNINGISLDVQKDSYDWRR